MTTKAASIRSELNNLIQTCKDGQVGFRVASENIDDSGLKSTLSSLSLQRSQFAGELQQLAVQLGESDPEDSGSAAGAIHRGWMNLKAAITGKGDRYAILAECESGEDSAVKEYRRTLEASDLPADIRAVVSRQYRLVQAAHDQVKALRDAAKDG